MKMELRQDLWGRDYRLDLELPEHWDVSVLPMEGDRKEPLVAEDYRKALAPLEARIRGRKEVCILFDDLSRPTRAYAVMPFLLELFERSGIRDEQVRFLCSLGTHGPLGNAAFRKKLGAEVLERFPVYNHNPYENCVDFGRTALGTPILVNKEYAACDLRIGIGSFLPHSFCGYGGGYKIVMPGVAHIDAITHHHGKLLKENWAEVYGIGRYRKNVLLDDLREFGRKVPLDAKIDFMVNSAAEAVGLFVGDPDAVYAAQADLAAGHYGTLVPARADIVIANAYAKGNEAMIALSLAEEMLKDGGDVVVLCDVDDGQAIHYLLGRFGRDSWGRLAFGERQKAAAVRRIFVYSRFKDHQGRCWFGQEDDVTWCNDIHGLMRDLDADYAGRSPTVFVIPDGTIQTARFADKA